MLPTTCADWQKVQESRTVPRALLCLKTTERNEVTLGKDLVVPSRVPTCYQFSVKVASYEGRRYTDLSLARTIRPFGREALGGAAVVRFSRACSLQANGIPVSAFPVTRGEAYGMPVKNKDGWLKSFHLLETRSML